MPCRAVIIGKYFFENEYSATTTINGDSYRTMVSNFFVPAPNDIVVNDVWFQQDGASCNTSHVTIDFLRLKFDSRLITEMLMSIGLQETAF